MAFSSALILFLIAGAMNGLMDVLAHHWYGSVFFHMKGFWHRFFHEDSWRNKYVNGWDFAANKYVRNNTPIAFTDGWHLAKSVMLWCLSLGAGLSLISGFPFNDIWTLIICVVLFRASFGAGFAIVYYTLKNGRGQF